MSSEHNKIEVGAKKAAHHETFEDIHKLGQNLRRSLTKRAPVFDPNTAPTHPTESSKQAIKQHLIMDVIMDDVSCACVCALLARRI